jgi:hypothetical protein
MLGRESNAEERGFLETEWPARRRALRGRERE